jgi:DNA invertase Pin-like site-specific DNA recombinase
MTRQWMELIVEARCPDRRFDAVVMYQTRCLSRDRVSAGLFERELRRLSPPVQVHYPFGGDCSTSEGQLMVAIGQAIDEFERGHLNARRGAGSARTRSTPIARALARPTDIAA